MRICSIFYSLCCRVKITLLTFLLFSSSVAHSQVTSSGIRGIISVDKGELPQGITITATHIPSGAVYSTISQKAGNYNLPNLKSGGSYTIVFSAVGFSPATVSDLTLALGNFSLLNPVLYPASQVMDTLTITGRKYNTIHKPGISTTIIREQLERLPTITRSLQDFTRLSPQANGNSFGGANYRYNNLSVDGAALNDAFGFTESVSGAGGSQATGTPGSLAKTQPISLEAIDEVQVEVAPYNVIPGNFTGGSINAVTRSGTNRFAGSVFFSGRNQAITGKSLDNKRSKIDAYSDYQTGFRAGGSIFKNKLFYFTAVEIARKNEPVLFAPGDGSQIPIDIARSIYDSVLKKYGYDAGTYGEKNLQVSSNKIFTRLDWNLNAVHKLSIRNNYVQAFSNNLERNANVLNFGSQGFRHNSATSSTVFEIKSNFSSRVSNSLVLGYTNTVDSRDIKGKFFPHIEITYNTANTIFLGAYREAAVYGLTLKTFEFTDNLVFYRNKHTITLGTHNEFYDIDYRFLTAFNGRWAYRSVEDFYNERPSRIRGVYNLQNNDYEFNRHNPSAKFRVMLLGQDLQDEIAVSKKLRLTLGVRLDHALYPDREKVPAKVQQTKGFEKYTNASSSQPQLAPRLGFNWDVKGNQQFMIRGGSGIFNGRMPFAWLAYPYYNNGVNYGNVDTRPTGRVPLEKDIATVAAR